MSYDVLLIKGKIPVQNLIWPALIWLCKNKKSLFSVERRRCMESTYSNALFPLQLTHLCIQKKGRVIVCALPLLLPRVCVQHARVGLTYFI